MKSKIIGRRQILIFVLTSSLCLAVFVNWYYTKPNNLNESTPEVTDNVNLGEAQFVNGSSVVDNTNYFESAKLNRTKAHDSAKELLQNLINDNNSDENTKASAREKLTKISETIKIEADCENLISAQISKNCLVTIDEDSAEIIVPKDVIDEKTIVKIKDIMISKASVNAENITIVELK